MKRINIKRLLKKINKKKLIIILVIVNLLILGVGSTIAAYKSQASGSSSLQYAKIVFNNEEVNSLSIDLTNIVPGERKTIQFSISNYKDSNRSDVQVAYKLLIRGYALLPQSSVIVKNSDNNQVVFTCNSSTGSRNVDGVFECQTPTRELNLNSNTVHHYILEYVYPTNISSEYEGISDYIEIIIDSWQKQS